MGEKGARNGGRLLPASCIVPGQAGGTFHDSNVCWATDCCNLRTFWRGTHAACCKSRQRTSALNVTGSASWRNSCSTSALPRTSTGDRPSLLTAACG